MRDDMKKILSIAIIVLFAFYNIGAVVLSVENDSIEILSTIDDFDMVIISPNAFSDEIQPLIDHKNDVGVKTFLKTTEEIYHEYNGRDDAESIKLFIKDSIENTYIKYVLLFGGKTLLGYKWNVPSRYVNLDDGFGYSTFLSDLYFADVYKEDGSFDDWDSNGNGIFAEWGSTGDVLDLKPDVSLGRLPCRSKAEVEIVVEKIINYERNTNGGSWFNRLVLVGGDTFPTSEGYEGEFTCEQAASYMVDFDIVKLFTSTGLLTGSEDIISAINQGCGFLFTRGRGGQDRIRMVYPEGDEFIVFQNDEFSQLTNNGMYPICILGECMHGKFDVGFFNIIQVILGGSDFTLLDCIFECIAWEFVNQEDAGAIGVITNSNICYGSLGDADDNGILDDAEKYGGFLGVECFRLYGEEQICILGDLHKLSIQNYCEQFPVHSNIIDCKSILENLLIGDPSLKIGGY
jgi:hypothetical protein